MHWWCGMCPHRLEWRRGPATAVADLSARAPHPNDGRAWWMRWRWAWQTPAAGETACCSRDCKKTSSRNHVGPNLSFNLSFFSYFALMQKSLRYLQNRQRYHWKKLGSFLAPMLKRLNFLTCRNGPLTTLGGIRYNKMLGVSCAGDVANLFNTMFIVVFLHQAT